MYHGRKPSVSLLTNTIFIGAGATGNRRCSSTAILWNLLLWNGFRHQYLLYSTSHLYGFIRVIRSPGDTILIHKSFDISRKPVLLKNCGLFAFYGWRGFLAVKLVWLSIFWDLPIRCRILLLLGGSRKWYACFKRCWLANWDWLVFARINIKSQITSDEGLHAEYKTYSYTWTPLTILSCHDWIRHEPCQQ